MSNGTSEHPSESDTNQGDSNTSSGDTDAADDGVDTAPATSGHSDAGSQAQRNQDDESPS